MSDRCTEDVPVLLRRTTFCGAFAADARDFRVYSSWVLSLMLSQVGAAPTPTFSPVPLQGLGVTKELFPQCTPKPHSRGALQKKPGLHMTGSRLHGTLRFFCAVKR